MNSTTVSHPAGVVLTNAKFKCTKCGKWKSGDKIGLREMKNGQVRNQAQCNVCRSGK